MLIFLAYHYPNIVHGNKIKHLGWIEITSGVSLKSKKYIKSGLKSLDNASKKKIVILKFYELNYN